MTCTSMMPSRGGKLALLTVGSTEFRPLVDAALSQPVLDALRAYGCTRFIVQYGKQERPSVGNASATGSASSSSQLQLQLQVELHAFMGDIEEKMVEADLVLCHAGAGSILAALRGPALSPLPLPSSVNEKQRHLVIVPNDTLMDAHQSELAEEMHRHGWAVVATPSTLAATIRELRGSSVTEKDAVSSSNASFPPFDPSKIQSILDETLGIV